MWFSTNWRQWQAKPFRDALFQPTLLANPLPLTSWTRILTVVYEHSENVLQEFEKYVPVTTQQFQMMRYEVTRGQWGEFLEAVQMGDPIAVNEDGTVVVG